MSTLLTASRIRTFRCHSCDELIATNRLVCESCKTQYSPEAAEVAANREDFLLQMEHDASHASHSVFAAYLWYVLAGLLIGWHAKEDITALDFNLWAYLHELQAFLVTGVLIIPIFLAYAAWQLVSWHRRFSRYTDPDPRVVEARREYYSGWRQFALATALYLVLVVTPLVLRGVNVLGL
jgi:hypothetical protein